VGATHGLKDPTDHGAVGEHIEVVVFPLDG
jgi:hypothetical protein